MRLLSTDNQPDQLLTIGAMAKLAGLTVRTLRYYEEVALIGPAKRSDSKYRLYSQATLKRIKAITALQDLGYSLEQILVSIGPYACTSALNKTEQLEASRKTLKQLKTCIDSKMQLLLEMNADVDKRLHTLDGICMPCVSRQPESACDTACHHREAHLD